MKYFLVPATIVAMLGVVAPATAKEWFILDMKNKNAMKCVKNTTKIDPYVAKQAGADVAELTKLSKGVFSISMGGGGMMVMAETSAKCELARNELSKRLK